MCERQADTPLVVPSSGSSEEISRQLVLVKSRYRNDYKVALFGRDVAILASKYLVAFLICNLGDLLHLYKSLIDDLKVSNNCRKRCWYTGLALWKKCRNSQHSFCVEFLAWITHLSGLTAGYGRGQPKMQVLNPTSNFNLKKKNIDKNVFSALLACVCVCGVCEIKILTFKFKLHFINSKFNLHYNVNVSFKFKLFLFQDCQSFSKDGVGPRNGPANIKTLKIKD